MSTTNCTIGGLLHNFRGPLRSAGMRERFGLLAHVLQQPRLGSQFGDFLEQSPAVHLRIEHQACGAGSGEGLGVAKLMLVRRGGRGTRIEGFPAAASSPTVPAPARHTTRSACAKAPGMSSI